MTTLADDNWVCCPKCANVDVKVWVRASEDAKFEEAQELPCLPDGQDMFLGTDPITTVECEFCGAVHAWDGRKWQDTKFNLHGSEEQMGQLPPTKLSPDTSTGCKVD